MLSEPKRMNARLNRNDTSCVLEGPRNINFIMISSVQTSVYTSNFFCVTRNPVSEHIQALRVETSHTLCGMHRYFHVVVKARLMASIMNPHVNLVIEQGMTFFLFFFDL